MQRRLLMTKNKKEVWPVMLTPFTDTGEIDYTGLHALIEWYETAGVHGLFAVCQSSEMFFLSLEERIKLATFVKKHAKVPVIASGHISPDIPSQIDELRRISDTGIDGLVLVTNRPATEDESPEIWIDNTEKIINALDPAMPLGLYECPYPYRRIMTDEEVAFCGSSGRFHFMKDTCKDIEVIRRRISILEGTPLRIYNANSSTLLDSLHLGATGFSGVMANFHPELYVKLLDIWEDTDHAQALQSLLSITSLIEKQCYPVIAKYHLSQIGLPIGIYSRGRSHHDLTPLFKDEVRQLNILTNHYMGNLGGYKCSTEN